MGVFFAIAIGEPARYRLAKSGRVLFFSVLRYFWSEIKYGLLIMLDLLHVSFNKMLYEAIHW